MCWLRWISEFNTSRTFPFWLWLTFLTRDKRRENVISTKKEALVKRVRFKSLAVYFHFNDFDTLNQGKKKGFSDSTQRLQKIKKPYSAPNPFPFSPFLSWPQSMMDTFLLNPKMKRISAPTHPASISIHIYRGNASSSVIISRFPLSQYVDSDAYGARHHTAILSLLRTIREK